MKVLLTGSSGQVGWEVCRQAPGLGVDVIAADRSTLDLADSESIEQALTSRFKRFDCVINAAAYTAVDKAESEPELARQVNAAGPGLLARLCAEKSIPLIHFSTDYVFDGDATRAWREDDPVAPLGVYGRTKLDGEQAIREALDRHVILRTSWVFGVHGHNFVKTMLRLGSERDELTVVADQIGCPTFAGHIASAALGIAQRISAGEAQFGTWHFCDDGPTTWHSFASQILEQAHAGGLIGRVPVVKPIATADYPTPARRPAYSVLNTTRFSQAWEIPIRPWQDGLARILEAKRNAA